jgi:hypothetical protein
MHTRYADLARITTAYRDEPATLDDDLRCARGIALALIASVPVWALLGMLAALAWRWS